MNRKLIVVAAVPLLVVALAAGIMLSISSGQEKEVSQFTYPLSVDNKTFVVTVVTNWTEDRAPSVTLLNSSRIRHSLELYFLGGTKEKTVSYNITIPTGLLDGNISLIRKYYLQDPNSYTLTNNGTHNSLQMTFDYQPFFSGSGYFEVLGTEGAW